MQRPVGPVFDSAPPDGRERCLVDRTHRTVAQLTHVPIGVGQGQADDRYILSDSRYFLGPPEGECVVVAIGKEDAVRRRCVQQVIGEIRGQGGIGTVSPRGGRPIQHQRHSGKHEHRGREVAQRPRALDQLSRHDNQPHPGPEPPHDEAHNEEVVPLPDLVAASRRIHIEPASESGSEVHVDHKPDTGDHEQGKQQPPGGGIGPSLGECAAKTEPNKDQGDGNLHHPSG